MVRSTFRHAGVNTGASAVMCWKAPLGEPLPVAPQFRDELRRHRHGPAEAAVFVPRTRSVPASRSTSAHRSDRASETRRPETRRPGDPRRSSDDATARYSGASLDKEEVELPAIEVAGLRRPLPDGRSPRSWSRRARCESEVVHGLPGAARPRAGSP